MSIEFSQVRQIAAMCLGIDDKKWRHTLDKLDEQGQNLAIRECMNHVTRITNQKTIQCAALVFKKVHPRIKETDLCITTDSELTQSLKETLTFPLSSKEATFYLRASGGLFRVEMKPKNNKVVEINYPIENSIWNLSLDQVNAMVKEEWNNAFISACYMWDAVVPLPTLGEEEGKQ